MARPLRIEFPSALYHITSRGDHQESIFIDDDDRQNLLEVLTKVCNHFNWVVYAYCQMSNHYHVVIETVGGHLCRGMQQLNGVNSSVKM